MSKVEIPIELVILIISIIGFIILIPFEIKQINKNIEYKNEMIKKSTNYTEYDNCIVLDKKYYCK